MKIKKVLAVLLAVFMASAMFCFAAGAESAEKKLQFGSDGKFKIMMVNDYQDVDNANGRTVDFYAAALDAQKPDLVVLVGDQLSDVFPFATKERIRKAIDNICAPLEARGIPFLVTMGNHDHDRTNVVSREEQFEMYHSYSMCVAAEDGADCATYNKVIYGSDGVTPKFNIYMMDTNNKDENGGYCGVNAEQVEWYKAKSDELKALNGGKVLPSILFQHIPVKEVYQLLETVDYRTENAVFSTVDGNWYAIKEDMMVSEGGTMGEAPCSEDLTKTTGQYEAWLEKGDITLGAYFAHDHLNNFVGKTKDGIILGYNAGTGFRSYGRGGDRSVRVFEFDENDVENYSTRCVTYSETIEKLNLYITDIFSPALITKLMKVVYFLFGWLINLFK